MSRRFYGSVLLAFVGAFVVLFALIMNMGSSARSGGGGSGGFREGTSETLTFDLGTRSDSYGSTWQATELLSRIQQNPNATVIVITARDTSSDQLSVTADLRADRLIRRHVGPSGTSTQVWDGYLIDRIKSAAGGGSLNDTPVGKRVGTYTT